MPGDIYPFRDPNSLGNLPSWEEDYQNRLARQQAQQSQRDQYNKMMQQLQASQEALRRQPKTATEAYLNAEGGILLETSDGGKVVIPAGLLKALGTLVAMAEMAKLVPADDHTG